MDPFQRHTNPTITTTKCLFTNMTQHDVTCDVTNRIDIDRYFKLMKEEMSRLEVDDTNGNGREFRRSWSGSRTERRKRKERDPKKRLSCSDADDVSERYKRQFKRFDENSIQGRDTESRLTDVENPGSFRFIDPNFHFDNKKNSLVRIRRRSYKRSASLNSDFGQTPTATSSIDPLDLFCQNPFVYDTDSFRSFEEKEKEDTILKAEDSQSDNESTVDESRTSNEPWKSVRSMRRWKSLEACVHADVQTDDDFNYINLNVFEKTIDSNSISDLNSSLIDTQGQVSERKKQTNEQSESTLKSSTHNDSFDEYKGKSILLDLPKPEDARHRSYSWSDNFKSRHRESAHIHRRLVKKSKSIDVGEISHEKKLDRSLERSFSNDNLNEESVTLRLSCSPEHKKRSRSRDKKVRKTSINTKIVEDVISEQDGENNEEISREVKGDIVVHVTDSKLPLENDDCTNIKDIKTSGLSSSL